MARKSVGVVRPNCFSRYWAGAMLLVAARLPLVSCAVAVLKLRVAVTSHALASKGLAPVGSMGAVIVITSVATNGLILVT